VLSHRPAGAEWGLRRWSGRPSITVPGDRRSNAAIEVHRCALPPDEITVSDGIPITSVPRTLLDLATLLDDHALLIAVEEAEKRQLRDPLSLPALLERHRGHRGAGRLRRVLERIGYGIPKEALEELFARFVARHRLPRPELNATVSVGDRNYSPDCLWRRQRLIVELHSARHHGTTPAISRDATRDRILLIAGWRVIHVTWAQLHDRAESAALARDLLAALGCDP
jgi:very-short-patch-repair endonuclease